jgi:hypothetical protein
MLYLRQGQAQWWQEAACISHTTRRSRAASRRLPGSGKSAHDVPAPQRARPVCGRSTALEQGGTIGQAVHGERDGCHTHLLPFAARVAGIVRDTRTALKDDTPLAEQMLGLCARATPTQRQDIRDRLASQYEYY